MAGDWLSKGEVGMASEPHESTTRDDDDVRRHRHLTILDALPPSTRDVVYDITVEMGRVHGVIDSESSPPTSE